MNPLPLMHALFAAAVMALPIPSPLPEAQATVLSTEARDVIAQAVAWDDAIIHKRRAEVEANMADDFLHISGDGTLSDRSSFVERILSPKLTIAPYAMEDVRVSVHGSAAILTGTTNMHGTWDGKPFTSHYRFTDTYIRQHGTWKVVHVQITEFPAP